MPAFCHESFGSVKNKFVLCGSFLSEGFLPRVLSRAASRAVSTGLCGAVGSGKRNQEVADRTPRDQHLPTAERPLFGCQ